MYLQSEIKTDFVSPISYFDATDGQKNLFTNRRMISKDELGEAYQSQFPVLTLIFFQLNLENSRLNSTSPYDLIEL